MGFWGLGCSGFGVQSFWFSVWGLGFGGFGVGGLEGLGLRDWGVGEGLEFEFEAFGDEGLGFGIGVQGLGCRV